MWTFCPLQLDFKFDTLLLSVLCTHQYKLNVWSCGATSLIAPFSMMFNNRQSSRLTIHQGNLFLHPASLNVRRSVHIKETHVHNQHTNMTNLNDLPNEILVLILTELHHLEPSTAIFSRKQGNWTDRPNGLTKQYHAALLSGKP